MNSITSVDHKSADSAVHETTVNAVGKLHVVDSTKKLPNPVKSEHVLSILRSYFFSINKLNKERILYENQRI